MARSTGCLCAVPEVLGQRPLLGGFDPSGLVVEDGYDVRAYSVEVLRELGYRVLEAHDRLSALRLPEWQKARVDLLFSGVVLPSGMIGPQLVEAARALRHGRLEVGVDLITKPFSYADLAQGAGCAGRCVRS